MSFRIFLIGLTTTYQNIVILLWSKEKKRSMNTPSDSERLDLLKQAMNKSMDIPLGLLTESLAFEDEKILIQWLWKIELEGFEIDHKEGILRTKQVTDDVSEAIDSLLLEFENYEKQEIGKKKTTPTRTKIRTKQQQEQNQIKTKTEKKAEEKLVVTYKGTTISKKEKEILEELEQQVGTIP